MKAYVDEQISTVLEYEHLNTVQNDHTLHWKTFAFLSSLMG